LNSVTYKGFAVIPRTYQIRGSGRWTLDLVIRRHSRMRAFSAPTTYATQEEAITGCGEFGRLVIDGQVKNCSVKDFSTD
jgi:hypothetical protein